MASLRLVIVALLIPGVLFTFEAYASSQCPEEWPEPFTVLSGGSWMLTLGAGAVYGFKLEPRAEVLVLGLSMATTLVTCVFLMVSGPRCFETAPETLMAVFWSLLFLFVAAAAGALIWRALQREKPASHYEKP